MRVVAATALEQFIAELTLALDLETHAGTDPAAWIEGVVARLREVLSKPGPTCPNCGCDYSTGKMLRDWKDETAPDGPADGSVVLTHEDARSLSFLLARAICEDDDASDADRTAARLLLNKLGGETQ